MKTKIAMFTMLAAGLASPAAFPCGAPFGAGINVDPKQDIVVVHKDDVETYVFQPRFCGSASNFGLILPVPSPLSEQPALSTAKVFSTLDSISKPTVVETEVCSGGMFGGNDSVSTGSRNGGASVVSSGTVGFMDWSQLKADSVTSFTDWLTLNGYPYEDMSSSAFAYYVSKGWYFVAFKISQGATTSASVCKDLGPVKLAFPTPTPVVPTRMATARGRDTTGAVPYSSNFSWRIFGITTGQSQLGFADGPNSRRALNYSGLLGNADIGNLDGLAQAGDRLSKLTLSFDFGSTDPDISLEKNPGRDFRETMTKVKYVTCGCSVAPAHGDLLSLVVLVLGAACFRRRKR